MVLGYFEIALVKLQKPKIERLTDILNNIRAKGFDLTLNNLIGVEPFVSQVKPDFLLGLHEGGFQDA